MENRLVLHTCCAPCATCVNRFFAEQGFKVVNVFYNPNIHPYEEYGRRLEALVEYTMQSGGVLYTPFPYDPREFFALSSDLEKRCVLCYTLRLQKVAQWAKEHGFAFFSTTLTLSPYQDVRRICEVGEQVGSKVGIYFLGFDLRRYFAESTRISKEMGLYRQNYCGCIASRWEGVKKRLWRSLTGHGSSSS